MDKYIDLILKNFPDKTREWAVAQIARAIDNIEGDADEEAIKAVLEGAFGITV